MVWPRHIISFPRVSDGVATSSLPMSLESQISTRMLLPLQDESLSGTCDWLRLPTQLSVSAGIANQVSHSLPHTSSLHVTLCRLRLSCPLSQKPGGVTGLLHVAL